MPDDLTNSDPPQPQSELVGPYRIEALLGEGGMSTVHLARHCTIGRSCAIKILRPESCSEQSLLARFVGEARLLSRVHHRNVVTIEGFGRTPRGAPYIVMEYLEGVDLQTTLAQRGRLPWREVAELTRQLLLALRAVHAQGIVHRDVKPRHCVLVATDEGGCLKLVDFGISASIVGEHGTKTPELIVGAPCYMAPEQARGEHVDPRTDLYAVGVMVFELLTGRPPFMGATAPELLAQHLGVVPPSLRAANPDCDAPPWLDRFVQQAMAEDPEHRFADADQMLRALEDAQRGGVDRGADSDDLPRRRRHGMFPRASVVAGGVAALGLAVVAAPSLGLDPWAQASPIPLVVEELIPAPTPSRVLLPMEAAPPSPERVVVRRAPPAPKVINEPVRARARARARQRRALAERERASGELTGDELADDDELAGDEPTSEEPTSDEPTSDEPSPDEQIVRDLNADASAPETVERE